MLRFARQTFTYSRPVTQDDRVAVLSYAQLLLAEGYLARRGHAIESDLSSHQLVVSGILSAENGLEQARHQAPYASQLAAIRAATGADDAMAYTDVLFSEDDYYADEPPWKALQLSCDVVMGTSPVQTADGAIVARHRLTLDDELAADLWQWDTQYDSIYQLWLRSDCYESWAEQELCDPESDINVKGQDIARRIAAVIGRPVEYVMHTLDE